MSINRQARAARRPYNMVALDHRNSLERDLVRLGTDAAAGHRAELKVLIWRGIAAVLPGVPAHADAAILIDRGNRRVVAEATEAGITVAIALEASGAGVLIPEASPAALEADLRALDGGFGKILLRWNPADGEARKRGQLATLRQLADLTHQSGSRLLLELLVPPSPQDLAGLAGGRRWDETLLPHHQHDAVAEVLDAGIAPALWKLEGHPDAGAAAALAELVGPSGSILVLGGGAGIADIGRIFSGGAGLDAFSGFAVGRSIWWGPIAELCRGEVSEASARKAIGRNFLAVIDAFEAAARKPPSASRE